jgi:hypothetical protein
MEEERSKLGKSSWIMLGAAIVGFGIFIAVFMYLQGDHEGDIKQCVEKCKTMPECRYVDDFRGTDGNPCAELCELAPHKAMTCMDTSGKTCEGFSSCVVENP